MPSYEIQFSANDVFDRFQEIKGLKREQKENTLAYFKHELCSEIAAALSCAERFTGEETQFNGRQPDIYQRGYIDNLYSSGRLVFASLDDIFLYCEKRQSEDIEHKCRKACEGLVGEMKKIASYLPTKDLVLKLGNVAPRRQRALEELDMLYGMVFYTHNLEFAKKFQRDVYHLRDDVRTFIHSQFRNRGPGAFVGMDMPSIVPMETKVNYFKNAVLPLIKNIQQHAFNPENDIEGRLQHPENLFRKSFRVYSAVDEEKQQIVIMVEDNGFGIRPEIKEKLFERGISTKKISETEHGVGLWAVKEFVEANGGKIMVETKLGTGTSFKFTIPYRKKDHFMYRQ